MTSAKARARSIAHRWGPVCPASPTVQWALGIRFDEEDDAASETFVVKLTPGKAEITDQLPGRAEAVAASTAGHVFVLDGKGTLVVNGRRHRLAAPRALTWLGDGAALAGADRLWLFDGDGSEVREGPPVKAAKLASSAEGLMAALDDGSVVWFDDLLTRGAVARGRPVAVEGAGHVGALALADDGKAAAAAGRVVLAGNARAGKLAPIATAPFDVHAVAVHNDRILVSSRAHGLFTVDEDERRIEPWRPSLRAHSLAVRAGLLVVASDLFVATSDDGIDLLTRDLAPFVRLAEQRLPRFHSPEDPLVL